MTTYKINGILDWCFYTEWDIMHTPNNNNINNKNKTNKYKYIANNK